jgi:hypothetical protein
MFIITIAAFCFAYYFVKVLDGAMILKRIFRLKPNKRLKPFDCVQCLTVWSALAFYFMPIEFIQVIAVIFVAGFLSIKIK